MLGSMLAILAAVLYNVARRADGKNGNYNAYKSLLRIVDIRTRLIEFENAISPYQCSK